MIVRRGVYCGAERAEISIEQGPIEPTRRELAGAAHSAPIVAYASLAYIRMRHGAEATHGVDDVRSRRDEELLRRPSRFESSSKDVVHHLGSEIVACEWEGSRASGAR